MAATEVHVPPSTTWSNNLEAGQLRASSTDPTDKKLNWLIQNETTSGSTHQDGIIHGISCIPKSDSSLEKEPQDKDVDIKRLTPKAGKETIHAAGDASSFEQVKESDEYYAQAAEQLLVQQELQKLKDEGIIPQSDEPVFDYDIAERVKQLNKELAEEGTTPMKKNRIVLFSENLVEYSTSPSYGDKVSESGSPRIGEADQPDPNDLEVEKLTLNDEAKENEKRQRLCSHEEPVDRRDAPESGKPKKGNELDRLRPEVKFENGATESENYNNLQAGESQDSQIQGNERYGSESVEQKQHGISSAAEDQSVVLERNGQFEVVNVKDLSTEERYMMGLMLTKPEDPENSNNSIEPAVAVKLQPSLPLPPPRPQRPSTAISLEQSGISRQQLPPRRIQSAKTHRESKQGKNVLQSSLFDWEARSSGYGMSVEQKSAMRKIYRLQLQQQRDEQKQKIEEKRRAHEENEKAFQCWLNKKSEEDKQKRKDEKEKEKKEAQEFRDPDGVFQIWVEKKQQLLKEEQKKATEEKMKSQEQVVKEHNPEEMYRIWLQTKKEQAKVERKIRRRMEEEKESAFFVRDRKECDRAFKDWLRSKNSQLRKDQSMKHSNALHSQQTAKLSRKSRQLAKALEIAQAYRYTDYCGYRF